MKSEHERQHYSIINRTERSEVTFDDITTYTIDETLGADAEITILVKWLNQTYHDENLRAMASKEWDDVAGIAKKNSWRHRNQYYDGLIVDTNLSADYFDVQSAERSREVLQPTGVSIARSGLTAYACADEIQLSPAGLPDVITKRLRNEMFARLHSVEFSQDDTRILTASSSLDLVHELNQEGEITWTFDPWEVTPYNRNKLGQKFLRKSPGSCDSDVLHNPSLEELKSESAANATCVLDDPMRYNGLGLSTNLTPVFLNTASYGHQDTLLLTSFHRGEAWIVDRHGESVSVVSDGMKSPHGLHRDSYLDGYMVTDTGNEKLNYISDNFEQQHTLDFSGLDERKSGLHESRWLQYVTNIGNDLYCAVIAPRQKITIFDPVRKVRRDIPFDKEWGVQMVVPRQQIVATIGRTATSQLDSSVTSV